MKDIVIVGTSGFAREIKMYLDRMNQLTKQWNFLGYIGGESDQNKIGTDEFVCNYSKPLDVVIAIGNGKLRKKLFDQYKSNSYLSFPNIIDPSVVLSDTVVFGEGNILSGKTIVTNEVTIGDFNIINMDCTLAHEVCIGNYNTISPSVNLSGKVKIGDFSSLGTACQVIPEKHIGTNSVIGAGSVLINDIPDNCTAVGVPAKVIKYN